jgi:hypothetical protein
LFATFVTCICQTKDRAKQRERETDGDGNASHPAILSAAGQDERAFSKVSETAFHKNVTISQR